MNSSLVIILVMALAAIVSLVVTRQIEKMRTAALLKPRLSAISQFVESLVNHFITEMGRQPRSLAELQHVTERPSLQVLNVFSGRGQPVLNLTDTGHLSAKQIAGRTAVFIDDNEDVWVYVLGHAGEAPLVRYQVSVRAASGKPPRWAS